MFSLSSFPGLYKSDSSGLLIPIFALCCAFALYLTRFVTRLVFYTLKSPLRHLPGPRNSSLLYGNLRDMRDGAAGSKEAEWTERYGPTFRIKGFFSINRLFTIDVDAIHHILKNDYDYQRPAASRWMLSRLLGNGVLVTEEDQHKFQRRVMNPAFGPTQVRALTSTFYEKALLLRDVWASQIPDSPGTANVEAFAGLNKATLDIIGLAGFGYEFNTLQMDDSGSGGKVNELYQAFELLFNSSHGEGQFAGAWRVLQALIPPLRSLPSFASSAFFKAKATMARIGNELLTEAKKLHSSTEEKADEDAKDLLSLLVKSNMKHDVPANQKMSDDEVLAQVPTFLVAGHETTSTSTAVALYALSLYPQVQAKLRQELLEVPMDHQPSMEDLNALPYLDAFTREVLRLYAPVNMTSRVAMRDDVLPLRESYTDEKGKVHKSISVQKGQMLHIPILAVNRDKRLWGEDASEFRPERWENPPDAISAIPGVWGSMLTFLGGNRACIGWRFSLIEMKVLLFTLVRAFEFELGLPSEEISIKKTGVISRPVVEVNGKRVPKLPLVIKAVKQD